jgi:hypothetical protein
MELDRFLDTVITTPEGWFCLAIGKSGGVNWFERWYRWPAQRDEILAAVATHRGEHNIYFSAHLFSMASSQKANVLPTRTIQADLDEADINHLTIKPSVLVNTSPGRHQAFWLLDELLPLDQLELLSRKLTYSIAKCDHSGWPLGHKFRIPDTFNFKYLDGPKPIEIIEATLEQLSISRFEMVPEVPAYADANVEDFVSSTDKITAAYLGVKGPQELLESLSGKIAGKTYVQYNVVATSGEGRSGAQWALMCQAFAKGGLNREQVFFLAKHSANNKFAELRHNADRELAKDVLRAEALVRSQSADPRAVILGLKSSGTAGFRKPEILRAITSYMQERGSFLHTSNDSTWYIRRDLGRPIIISERSEYLHTLMDIEYGLNATEAETSYTVHGLCAYARNLPLSGMQTALSYYDPSSRTLLLHTGRKDVLRITADRIDTIVDGSNNVIFPWQPTNEPFSVAAPNTVGVDGLDWAEVLFGQSANGDALSNLINLSRSDALALLRVWFLFLLFRNAAISRPILATFGQPGSGKSTLFRKVYALLYGRHKSVGSVTTQEDFDHGVAYDPFVVLDNVDTPERWLPDRLALSASTSDIVKRKLYTDADTIVLKRQALVGITAHNPRFGREDVADRLLLLTFERLEKFIPEQVIIDQIIRNRSLLWGAIVRDVQKIIATDVPPPTVQFRVEDFAWLGMWIADALGCSRELRSALESVKFGQRSFSLEEDAMLVTALRKVLDTDPNWINERTPPQMWARLERAASDPQAFVKTYRNSTALGKKLLSLQDALKLTFEITWRQDVTLSTKLWTIKDRPTNGHANGAL